MKILICTLIMMSAFAQSTPLQTEQALIGEVEVSRATIRDLTLVLGQSHSSNFDQSDYLEKMKKVNRRLQKELDAFDLFLEERIVKSFRQEVEDYNGTYQSEDFSYNQKLLILKDLKRELLKTAAGLTTEYRKAYEKIITTLGALPKKLTFNGFATGIHTWSGSRYRFEWNVYSNGQRNDHEAERVVFQQYTENYLMDGCRTRSCVLLTSSDYVTLLQKIRAGLDKPFTVKLQDGAIIKIEAPNVDLSVPLSQIHFGNENEAWTENFLSLPLYKRGEK